MVALVRTVVGVSLVGGLLVVLLWSEQQVGVKTPAHTHFHAHARGIPPDSLLEESSEKLDVTYQTITEKLTPDSIPRILDIIPKSAYKSPKSNSKKKEAFPSTSANPEKLKDPKPKSRKQSDSVKLNFKDAKKLTPSTSPGQSLLGNTTASRKSLEKAFIGYSSSTPGPPESKNLVFSIDQSVPISNSDMPKIYVITPTYRRPEQIAELTRLSQTLMLVPNIHWLVAEDSVAPTRRVLAFLDTCSIPHTYLLAASARRYRGANKPRGVSNRNAGLKWLRGHAKEGVFYFADDDNTYDYRIFNELRWTKRVSMFPVGLVTRLGVSSPIVSDGKLIGFYDGWIAGRKFPVDMAGFAVNVQFYIQREAPMMPYSVGFEEDGFLKALRIKPEEIEPLADNCTKILVWHTRTVKSVPALQMPDTDKVSKTNLNYLKPQMVFQSPFGLS